jgi:hypothetical protein
MVSPWARCFIAQQPGNAIAAAASSDNETILVFMVISYVCRYSTGTSSNGAPSKACRIADCLLRLF